MKPFNQFSIISLRGKRSVKPHVAIHLNRCSGIWAGNIQLTRKLLGAVTLAMIFLNSSCAVLDALNATQTPVRVTETPTLTPTFVWFPASVTPTTGPLATPKPPTPEKRPGIGPTTLTDDFSDPTLWSTASSNQGSANVNDNRIILSVKSKGYIFSLRRELSATDYYAEIIARPDLCLGEDSYGLLVRANSVAYYRFSLTCSGNVSAERISVGTREVLQTPLPSGDVPRGAPGEVRIGIWAVGKEMRLFLNDRYQFSISNSHNPSGTIGVFVNSAGKTPVIMSFSRLRLQNVNYVLPTRTPKP